MSRRKQTKPNPREVYETDLPYTYSETTEGEVLLQENCGPYIGTSVKERSPTESQKISLLEIVKKQTTTKRQRDFSDSDEEPAVPYRLYQELQDSCGILKKRLRQKDVLIAGKEAVVRKLKQKCKRMTLELGKIRKLNICLQEQLLLKDTGSPGIQGIYIGSTESPHDPNGMLIVSEEEASDGSPAQAIEENDFGKVDLGYGVLLDRQRWKVIQRMDSHSKFCKSLAVAIWGTETLKERTVTGSKSNAVKGSVAKPPLSPEKVGVIRDCLKGRLQQRGYQKEAVDGQLRLVRRFLSEKICDIKRKVSVNSKNE